MDGKDGLYWLGFSAFNRIGPVGFMRLLSVFGSAEKAWYQDRNAFSKIGWSEVLITSFQTFRNSFSLHSYSTLLAKQKISALILSDPEYPKLLKEIPDPPYVLYVRGKLPVLPAIAVVGTRTITSYGRHVTVNLTSGLVAGGMAIVSGMAYGVDTVAHETALSQNGSTIAVLGSGIDVIYPKANTGLYWKIIRQGGAVISEYAPGIRADKRYFPQRNRIISGISLGVVVTEGAIVSGSLITARFAADQGRDVYAVPGPVTSALSKGPEYLLKQGAKLISEAADILEEYGLKTVNPSAHREETLPLTTEEKSIYTMLEKEELHFDEIARKMDIPIHEIGTLLSLMELKGFIRKTGSGTYGIKIN